MTEPHGDYTPARPLPVDREIELAIETPGMGAIGALDLADARIRIGLGRALVRKVAARQRYEDELAAFVRENESAQVDLIDDISRIGEQFADYVREQRRVTKENTLMIPGIGVWSTRRQNPRWKIDNALLIEALDDDEKARYTETPPPPPLKLKRDDYISEVLDPMITVDAEGDEIDIDAPPLGVERISAEVIVSYSLNV